jgi:hypothetical protein
VIERYLAELAPLLPIRGRARRRILAEVEDHLRESAGALGSEREAIRRFGAPEVVAVRFSEAGAVQSTRWALVALALAGAGLAAAGLVAENTLPPAPWAEREAPGHLSWKLDAALAGFLVAFAAGVAGILLRRRLRAALAAVGLGATALAGAAMVGAVEELQRAALYRDLDVAGAYSPAESVLVATWAGALALLALALAGLALYRLRAAARRAQPG